VQIVYQIYPESSQINTQGDTNKFINLWTKGKSYCLLPLDLNIISLVLTMST